VAAVKVMLAVVALVDIKIQPVLAFQQQLLIPLL